MRVSDGPVGLPLWHRMPEIRHFSCPQYPYSHHCAALLTCVSYGPAASATSICRRHPFAGNIVMCIIPRLFHLSRGSPAASGNIRCARNVKFARNIQFRPQHSAAILSLSSVVARRPGQDFDALRTDGSAGPGLKGVAIGDIGPKLGFNSTDNGFCRCCCCLASRTNDGPYMSDGKTLIWSPNAQERVGSREFFCGFPPFVSK